MAFRRRFSGSALLFYLTISSLILPSILVGLGIGLSFNQAELEPSWWGSALGRAAHLDAALRPAHHARRLQPLRPRLEEAARDLGATSRQSFAHVVLPIVAPSVIGIALFGFTLSFDEFARTLLTAGSGQHLAARDPRHDDDGDDTGALRARQHEHAALLPGDRLALLGLLRYRARA